MARIPALLLSMCLVVLALVSYSEIQAQAPGGGGGGGGRFGGGMFGGPGGRNSSTTWLLNQAAVQEELKITDAQKKRLASLNDALDERRRELFPQNQRGGRRGQGGGGDQGGGIPGGQGGFQGGQGGFQGGQGGGRPDPETFRANMEAMRENMEALQQETNNAIAKILTPKQRLRLNQISLQQQGPLAVARPEIAEKLNMSPEQLEQVQAIIQESRQSQMELFRSNFGGRGRGNRGRNGGDDGEGGGGGGRQQTKQQPKAQAKQQPKAQDDDDENPGGGQAQAKGQGGQNGDGQGRRGPGGFDRDSPEAKAQFAKMRDQSEQLQQRTITLISKVLTKKQKLAFNKMQGEPFDLDKLEPGYNGQRANAKSDTAKGNAKGAAKSKSESTTTSKKKATSKTRKSSGAA